MASFAFSGRDEQGKRQKGVVIAANIMAARSEITARRIIPITINESREENNIFEARMSDKEAAEIARDLARFLKAGLPLVPSIRALTNTGMPRRLNLMLERAASKMESGKALSEALCNEKGRSVQSLAGVIRVGEKTGLMAEGLEDAARSFTLTSEFKSQIASALAYPLLIVIMVIAALSIFITVVLPNLRPLFEGSDLAMPQGIGLVFKVSDFLSTSAPYALLAITGVLLAYILVKPFRNIVTVAFEKASFTPIGLGLANSLIYANVARRLSLGLSVGITAPEALREAIESSSYNIVKSSGAECIKAVTLGQQLSDAIRILPGIPSSFVNLARAGETAGKLAPAIKETAALLEQTTKTKAERISALLAPIITIFVGIIVGVIVIFIFSGLTSIADGILQ
mgnify:FL=1